MHAELKLRQSANQTFEGGSFQAGLHILRLSCTAGRWSVTVDSVPHDTWYTSQAGAWEAGVREADRLDRAANG